MEMNLYFILLEIFIDFVKNENPYKYSNTDKIMTQLFHRDKSSLSKFRNGTLKLPYTDFANVMKNYMEKKNTMEEKKSSVESIINAVGDRVKDIQPQISMMYFKDLLEKDGDSFYHEQDGYKKAIEDLTQMFYEVTYNGKNFAELQARRDKYRSYSVNYPKYQKTLDFISDGNILPDNVKKYFQLMEGEPAQSLIYNTLIYRLGPRFQEIDLLKIMAEIYHYQTLLNYKIGRVMPPSPNMPLIKDDYLMKSILREIKYRHFSHLEFPLDFDINITEEPDVESGKYKKFTDEVFDYYKNTYLNGNYSIDNISARELYNIIKKYQEVHTENSIENLITYLDQLF